MYVDGHSKFDVAYKYTLFSDLARRSFPCVLVPEAMLRKRWVRRPPYDQEIQDSSRGGNELPGRQ